MIKFQNLLAILKELNTSRQEFLGKYKLIKIILRPKCHYVTWSFKLGEETCSTATPPGKWQDKSKPQPKEAKGGMSGHWAQWGYGTGPLCPVSGTQRQPCPLFLKSFPNQLSEKDFSWTTGHLMMKHTLWMKHLSSKPWPHKPHFYMHIKSDMPNSFLPYSKEHTWKM